MGQIPRSTERILVHFKKFTTVYRKRGSRSHGESDLFKHMDDSICRNTWSNVHGAHEKAAAFLEPYTAFDLLQCMEQSPLTAAVWSTWSRCTNFPIACVAVPISEQKEHSKVASAFLEHMLQGHLRSIALCAPRMQLLHIPTGSPPSSPGKQPVYVLRFLCSWKAAAPCAPAELLYKLTKL